MSIIASIIIPTHNRSALLIKMLESLAMQSYPAENFEVIVVADGCSDNTVEQVRNYKTRFQLALIELGGLGAATARNEGAFMASGQYLIFADDDMELCTDFIKEHIAAHENENSVAIGYAPFMLESKASIQRMTLREWWEEKFQAMRNKHYRFRYADLTSGNFSISNSLFKKVTGFDTSLLCREDYELGFRLIKAGAEFCFAYHAKASHRDEVTDLKRSLQRKKSEGMADIRIKKRHAEFVNKEAVYYLSHRSVSKSILLKLIQYTPWFTDAIANLGAWEMKYFEKFRMLPSWLKMNYRLHQYWYLRGLMANVKSSKELYWFISNKAFSPNENQRLSIDLKSGLKKAEEALDQFKPLTVDIFYETKLIGTIDYEAGAEPIKGLHLRKILKDKFSDELFVAINENSSIISNL